MYCPLGWRPVPEESKRFARAWADLPDSDKLEALTQGWSFEDVILAGAGLNYAALWLHEFFVNELEWLTEQGKLDEAEELWRTDGHHAIG